MSKPLYNFGLSQEDAHTERQCLRLEDNDRLLCIASAGEIPLNLLALNKIHIVACDTSENQLFLAQLKLASVLHLKQNEAAEFIGFYHCSREQRRIYWEKLKIHLHENEIKFWDENFKLIEKGGLISAGKFERYLNRFAWIFKLFLGKKNLLQLTKLNSIEEQRAFFDEKIASKRLKMLFKIMFHPKIYKNRGIVEEGLKHQSNDSRASTFFFERFRDYCTSSLAKENCYFQFYLFGRVLYTQGLPPYLQKEGIENIRSRVQLLEFKHASFTQILESEEPGRFNKFHLSNIGDWMDEIEIKELFERIKSHVTSSARIAYRYIHKPIANREILTNKFYIENEFGLELMEHDMFPFYRILPISYNG